MQGVLGVPVPLVRRIEPQLEQPDQLGGDPGVRRERVVLVLLGERRGDALPVRAVRPHDLDLPPIQPRHHDQPIERIGDRLAPYETTNVIEE